MLSGGMNNEKEITTKKMIERRKEGVNKYKSKEEKDKG
jgi:hypothetical protein